MARTKVTPKRWPKTRNLLPWILFQNRKQQNEKNKINKKNYIPLIKLTLPEQK